MAALSALEFPSVAAVVLLGAALLCIIVIGRWRATVPVRVLRSVRIERAAGTVSILVGLPLLQALDAIGVEWRWWLRCLLAVVFAGPYWVAAVLIRRGRK